MLNVSTYTQMGYSEEVVRRAYEYSQTNRMDMFDALQMLQNQDRRGKESAVQNNIPGYSYLSSLRNFKLSDYEVLYSRSGVQENHLPREELRDANTPVGLLNVSNCCYLNSLLQCYFLMGSFTREILQAEPIDSLPEQPESRVRNKRIINEYKLMEALKEIFARMRLSSKKYLDPSPVLSNMVNSVGEKMEYGDEKDLHEINMCIVERLSECLMYTRKFYSSSDDSPSKLNKNQNIKQLFYGTKVEYTEGSESSEVQFLGLILNPKDNNLLTAIDSEFNYEVEIEGQLRQRNTYIRNLPQYLFININRTGYEKEANQPLKNEEKMNFDFVIYLDRYLDRNKEKTKLVNPKIMELLRRKNSINHQINHLELLATKLEECRAHAKYLKGWEERLPQPTDLLKEKQDYLEEIGKIEGELVEIEGREEKFVLMYLFVHRGDAISGHYWGYGRNGNHWYRFDINCFRIKESDILIDMERSRGTPYAMVYVRDSEIQSFGYPHHLQPSHQLLDAGDPRGDYSEFISGETQKKIIDENIVLHKMLQKERNKGIVEGILQDFKIKYNVVMAQGEEFMKPNPKIPNYENYSLFLHSRGEFEFMKYNIFSNCVFDRLQITTKELLSRDKLLKSLQKAFRKNLKGKMSLRHYAVEVEPEEGKKYASLQEEYLHGKKCYEFIKSVSSSDKLDNWPNSKPIPSLIDQIIPVVSAEKPVLYIKSLVRELVSIMVLDLAAHHQPIKEFWVEACQKKNPLAKEQISALSAEVVKEEANVMPLGEIEKSWKIENLRKNSSEETMGQIRKVIKQLSRGLEIYSENVKRGKLVGKGEPEELI